MFFFSFFYKFYSTTVTFRQLSRAFFFTAGLGPVSLFCFVLFSSSSLARTFFFPKRPAPPPACLFNGRSLNTILNSVSPHSTGPCGRGHLALGPSKGQDQVTVATGACGLTVHGGGGMVGSQPPSEGSPTQSQAWGWSLEFVGWPGQLPRGCTTGPCGRGHLALALLTIIKR